MRHLPLRIKFVLVFGAIVTMSAVIVAGVLHLSRERLAAAYGQAAADSATAILSTLSASITAKQDALRTAAADLSPGPTFKDRLTDRLRALSVAAKSRAGYDVFTNVSLALSPSDAKWYSQAVTDGAYADLIYDDTTKTNALVLAVPIPSADPKRPLGVIRATLSDLWLIRELSAAAKIPDADIRLLTRDGKLLYSSQTFSFGQSVSGMHFFQSIWSSPTSFFVSADPSRPTSPPSLFAFASMPSPPWYLLVSRPTKTVFAPIHDLTLGVAILTACFLVFGLTTIYFFSRSLIRPILELRDAARNVAAGDLTNPNNFIDTTSRDELGQLATDFNAMTDALTRSATLEARAAADRARHADELARSNEELTTFAHCASHDLQEPLRKIQAFADRLNDTEASRLSDRGLNYLARMRSAATRARTLIDDLLSFARVTTKAQPMQPTDLGDILSGVLSDIETRITDTNAQIITDGAFPTISADPTQMRQVFQNFLTNAIKYQPQDAPDHHPQVRVTASTDTSDPTSPVHTITFADNGIGFDPKYTQKIFEPFQRLHGREDYAGTGIGLAIVQKIILRHGGTIQVDSVPNTGSTFTLIFPVTSCP